MIDSDCTTVSPYQTAKSHHATSKNKIGNRYLPCPVGLKEKSGGMFDLRQRPSLETTWAALVRPCQCLNWRRPSTTWLGHFTLKQLVTPLGKLP
mmetsp:Transcript_118289/g.235617  ORF Transcript_118289/g.235617 Transcript_118289/m.235617 type:complete len:94 (-) Transcript_118289:1472-1753(-)